MFEYLSAGIRIAGRLSMSAEPWSHRRPSLQESLVFLLAAVEFGVVLGFVALTLARHVAVG